MAANEPNTRTLVSMPVSMHRAFKVRLLMDGLTIAGWFRTKVQDYLDEAEGCDNIIAAAADDAREERFRREEIREADED